jgi:predicted enzyme related to lactoylglutathione lyase
MSFKYTEAFVTLAASDFEMLVQFYTKLLALEAKIYLPNSYAEFQVIGLRLGIFKPKKSHEQEFANTYKSNISLCLKVEDLEKAIAYLTEIGYPPPGEIAIASHGKEIYACDPVGTRIILYQYS